MESSLEKLTGGFPQGKEDDKFQYIDGLESIQLIKLYGILIEYDVRSHVPSDIGPHQQFLLPETLQTQYRDSISEWTNNNLMKLNPAKSSFMLFSRSQKEFLTRLTLNSQILVQKEAGKALGVWIEEDAGSWSKNTTELCKSAWQNFNT